MKTVSAVELKRLKKRGKVRRKLGAQPEREKPEPVVKDDEGMSGSVSAERPAPALVNEPAIDMQPFASMAASMAASQASVEILIGNNTKVMQQFREDLAEIKKPRHRVPWEHTVKRTDKGLINKIISIPQENLLKSS